MEKLREGGGGGVGWAESPNGGVVKGNDEEVPRRKSERGREEERHEGEWAAVESAGQ